MASIARVIVEIALNREFGYQIPRELGGTVVKGSTVEVPFGRQATRGYVVALTAESEHKNLKSIRSVVGDKPRIMPSNSKVDRRRSHRPCSGIDAFAFITRSGIPRCTRTDELIHYPSHRFGVTRGRSDLAHNLNKSASCT